MAFRPHAAPTNPLQDHISRMHGRFVHNVVVWGSHSEMPVPDVSHASVDNAGGAYGDGDRTPGEMAGGELSVWLLFRIAECGFLFYYYYYYSFLGYSDSTGAGLGIFARRSCWAGTGTRQTDFTSQTLEAMFKASFASPHLFFHLPFRRHGGSCRACRRHRRWQTTCATFGLARHRAR